MRPALSDYQHLASGKVRELYRIDDDHLLFVATDRISAFDYVLDNEIPDKGRILTAMSVFFFDFVDAPNHLAGPPDDARIPDEVLGRALVVRELEMMPVECVARGYLTGSGLLDYQKTGEVVRHRAAAGSGRGQQVRRARCSPRRPRPSSDSTTRTSRSRDVIDLVGAVRANQLRDLHAADLHPGRRPRADARESSSPTPSSSSASTSTATWCWPTRSSPRTRRGTGPPTPTGRASCSPASTSSSSATG